jgi:hypothetical protein
MTVSNYKMNNGCSPCCLKSGLEIEGEGGQRQVLILPFRYKAIGPRCKKPKKKKKKKRNLQASKIRALVTVGVLPVLLKV